MTNWANAFQPILKDDQEKKQKTAFPEFMQQMSQQEKDKANAWLDSGAPSSQAVKDAAALKDAEPSSMSSSSGKIWGDVAGAGINAVASMLAALGKSKLARESEEFKAAAQGKANVLTAEQRLKSGVAANKSDIIKRLVETAGLIRR